ncbi:SPOR domain-containing protein [Comamonas jiangduensis]|uniref:SPOR domain-containing protein n=1 Tax=Comamonas jiangduensis TaxID=1194168 RepID=UPI0024E12CE6|nr:SPOR domain-containing protein [Comamonas jiangduensis]
MPATPSRSNAFTPPPSSGETGIMPDLYRLSVGPLNAAYYQQQFSRFETLGKAVPSWNHGAAFFTLAWLVLRKLWRPAGIYAGVVLALVLLWAFVLHARVPVAMEAAGCLFTLGLLCVVPGFLANGWYYQQVRSQTLSTLTAASSIAQARAKLGHGAPNKARLYRVTAVQAVVSVALAALVYSQWGHASRGALSTPAPSGPPDLVIPQVSSLYSPAPSAPWMEPVLPQAVATPVSTSLADKAALPETLPALPSATLPEARTAASPEPETLAAPLAAATTAAAATSAAASAPPIPATVPAPSSAAPTPAATRKTAPKQPAPPAAPLPAQKPTTKAAASSKTKAAEPAPAPPGRLIPGKYYLNAGVYAQSANVDRAAKQLQALKLNPLRQTISSSKGDLTRLRIGPFDTRKQAEQAAAKAKKLRMDTTVFQQPKQ